MKTASVSMVPPGFTKKGRVIAMQTLRLVIGRGAGVRLLLVATAWTLFSAGNALAQSVQENPPSGDVAALSGVQLFSGWKCKPNAISFTVDGGGAIDMASGTAREDTASACGNAGD